MNRRIHCFIIIGLILIAGCSRLAFSGNDIRPWEKTIYMRKNYANPFGVLAFLHWNHSWNNYHYASINSIKKSIALMKEAGIGWVRMDFLWQDIEPQRKRFDFGKYDSIVELLYENDIEILGILDYCADWASSCGEWNCRPVDNRLYVDFCSEVISRYKNKIKYWEIWNEPDSRIYWQPQDGLKSYCGLLKDVYIAAKQIDPECKILHGGLANGVSSLNKLYDNGAGKYFDIVNLHIFQSPLNPPAIKRVLSHLDLAYKSMLRNGDSHKKIWITELGCPGIRKNSGAGNWWLGDNPDEELQAQWLEEAYSNLIVTQSGVDKLFWAFFRDCPGHWNNGIDYFGMLYNNYSKKPAFSAYKRCFQNWKNYRSSLKENRN